jgi:hypothetical protein
MPQTGCMPQTGRQNRRVVVVEVVLGSSLVRQVVVDLYGSVGWSAYTNDPDTPVRALIGSSTVAVARDAGELVGLARVVSDGASIAYLQDVRQKVLLTDNEPGQKAFYESLGFSETRDFGEGTLRAFVRFD